MDRNELPEGWVWKKLGEIGKIVSGGTPSTTIHEYWDGNISWITPADLSGYGSKYIESGRKSITELGLQNSSARLIPKNSVLFSSRAPIGYVVIATREVCTNQGFKSVVPSKDVSSDFLYYFLKASKQEAEKVASGTTFKEISLKSFSELNIPLPPLPTQHAIVTKIEEIFSELDHGVAQLKAARAQLKVYKQAVLKWAFEGRLTNEVLVEGELPEGWKWVRLGEVADMCLGKMLDKQKNIGTFKPYLGNINVRWGKFNLDDLPQMRFEEKENERYNLKKGDLVICEGGEPGRSAIWKEQVPEMKIQKALHRVRFDKNTSPEFFYYYLQLIAQAKKIDQYFTGTTIKHLTGQSLKKIEFPLPPLAEQHQIVSEIERRLSVCDKMEEVIVGSLRQAEVVRQGVLKRAFEGKLV